MELALNAGLVSIIGQKGSGKSALAELIAYAAGSWEADSPDRFLTRAGKHLEGLEISLKRADGSDSRAVLGYPSLEENGVRYLSQKFVERLCAEDHLGTALVREIEAVIFSYIDPTDTLNASNFEELRTLLTQSIREEGDRLRSDINRLIREECALRDNAAKLPEKNARIKALTGERDGLVKQVPEAVSAEEEQIQKELQGKREALTRAQQAAGLEKQALQKIADIRNRVAGFKAHITRFCTELEVLLTEAGIPEADRAAFRPAFPEDTEAPLTRRATKLRQAIANREGAPDNPAEGTIRSLEGQIAALERRASADKARREKIRVIQTRIAAIGTELERLVREIAQIEGPEKARIAAARSERVQAYVAYFENLRREQETLQELYRPVEAKLHSGSASAQEQDLEFSIKWEADLPTWLERGAALFDQRKILPYGNMQGLAEAARKVLAPAWSSGDPAQIGPALDEFLTKFRDKNLPPSSYLRTGVTVQDAFDWLYETEHVRLTYGLKYNGVELEKLSPGTKGIVLLILYLGIDVGDTRPLIVDQPDENLDNESIYNLLTTYFKEAKQRRQIILITHNPNLVVNGDSEQVIVATARRSENGLPHMTYQSGALENVSPKETGIRQQVCRILEGGTDAFLKRERRYSLVGG
jgi:hypothetical protein